MKKTTWLLLIVIAALAFTAVYYAVDSVKAATNKSVLAPLSVFAGGTANAIYANSIWQTYVVPYQFLWGIALMGVFAVVWWKVLAPRAPTIRKPSLSKARTTASTGIRASTPPGATVRPETKTEIAYAPPVPSATEETVKPKTEETTT